MCFFCLVGTFWFHVTDRFIHALVTALVLPVTTLIFTTHVTIEGFDPRTAAFICSLLFASHPVHVEAVANTTGRAEVLCGFFYFLGFLVRHPIVNVYCRCSHFDLLLVICMLGFEGTFEWGVAQ